MENMILNISLLENNIIKYTVDVNTPRVVLKWCEYFPQFCTELPLVEIVDKEEYKLVNYFELNHNKMGEIIIDLNQKLNIIEIFLKF